MRKIKEATDKSTPYRTLGMHMVKAPVKPKNDPKSAKTIAREDFRTKGGQ